MATPDDLEVLKQSDKAANKRRTRPSLALAVTVLLLSIACVISPALATPIIPTAPIPATSPPTIAPTAVPPPSLTASASIPCRTGPTELDELIVNLQAGEKAEIVGKSNGFWVVKTADGSECWVPDQGVTTEGEVAAVPNVEPPPTPAPVAPAAPVNLQAISATCSIDKSSKRTKFFNQFHVSWEDVSNNEDGFWVYRDGDRVAELPADKTDVVDTITAQNNRAYVYYVIAYNAVGESKSEPIVLTCEGAGTGSGGGGGGGGPIGP